MSRPSSRRTRSAALASASVALAALTSVGAASAPASSKDLASCPAPYPVDSLARHQAVNGLTVSEGTDPAPFTGEVLGVLKDGISPGLDMILVRLTSDEIDRVGGIWAGMSGSPVYAEDGRLIGAVSYGLALGPSPVAGVTPAGDMESLLTDAGRGAGARLNGGHGKVALPRTTMKQLVAKGVLTAKQADSGLSRLKMPVAVGGIRNDLMGKVKKQIGIKGLRTYSAGMLTGKAAAAATDIIPGGNIGVSIAYGDFSYTGIGTVTAVCGDEVLAFGHPFFFSGKTTMGMHGADAIYIQEDPTLNPFKVANPTGPVGTIDQDRLAAVKGLLGDGPDATQITSHASLLGGGSRTGTTYAPLADFLPDVAALGGVVNNTRVFDASAPGSALTSFTISGTTKAGAPFQITRDNRVASGYDIAYSAPEELYVDLYRLLGNKFTAVNIDSIQTDTTLDTDSSTYKIGKVEREVDGTWVQITQRRGLRNVFPGDSLHLRVTTKSFRDELPAQTFEFTEDVPSDFSGDGYLSVSGSSYYDYYFGGGRSQADSFPAFLEELTSSKRNDQIGVSIVDFGGKGSSVSDEQTTAPLDHVVQGSKEFYLNFGGGGGGGVCKASHTPKGC